MMKAFAMTGRGEAGIIEVPKPAIKSPYNAILRPVSMSVCTSDVNTVYGTGSKKPDNLILGHECVAEVVQVGEEVFDFKAGDIVAVPAMTPDWRQVAIQEGNTLHAGAPFSANALGRSIPGEFAEYFRIEDADTTLAKVPEHVSIKDALMCTDMVTTGFTGVEAADIRFGDVVAVIGIGAVGLMAVQGAVLRGASRVIAVGGREICKNLAIQYGATDILDYKEEDCIAKVKSLTNGIGADAVLICGGGDESFPAAVEMVRYGIGRVVNLNHYKGEGSLAIPKFSGGRGMSGKSIYMELGKGGRARMERLLRLVETGRIIPGDLITHRLFGFDKLPQALEMMRKKGDDLIKIEIIPEWARYEDN